MCGWWFRPGLEAYQLLGLVMGVLFQLLIARRPLRQVWVADAEAFRLDRPGLFLAAGLALLAALGFFLPILPHRWSLFVPCVLGCLIPAAAFALRRLRADRVRAALPSFAAALVIGWATVLAFGLVRSNLIGFDRSRLGLLLPGIGLQFVTAFVVEEVIFRGALDSHVAPVPGRRAKEWGSAIFIAALWTAWHLPRTSLSIHRGIKWRRSPGECPRSSWAWACHFAGAGAGPWRCRPPRIR